MIRAKFQVHSVEETLAYDGGNVETVKLNAVYGNGEANASWSKASPSGQITMTISNPDAKGKLPVGAFVYVDLSIAPAA